MIDKENDKYITTKRNKEILIPIINNPTELVNPLKTERQFFFLNFQCYIF